MSDYKNTEEGKNVARKYADILNSSRPEPSYKHPRMTLSNRAKIFSPFAALRDYEEEIAAEGQDHLRVAKIELSEEDQGTLSDKLLQVRKGMTITVRFFEAENTGLSISGTPAGTDAPLGCYRTITGAVDRIDPVYRELQIRSDDKNVLGKELPWELSLRQSRNKTFSKGLLRKPVFFHSRLDSIVNTKILFV